MSGIELPITHGIVIRHLANLSSFIRCTILAQILAMQKIQCPDGPGGH